MKSFMIQKDPRLCLENYEVNRASKKQKAVVPLQFQRSSRRERLILKQAADVAFT